MIDQQARSVAVVERIEDWPSGRLTVVACPTKQRRSERRCGYVLLEAWTSSVCVERRRCKECGVWYRVRLLANGSATVYPEGVNLLH